MVKNTGSLTGLPPTEFAELMDRTGKLYRIQVNKDNVRWYWDHFMKYPMGKIKIAFQDAVEAEDYFPSIACIKKLIEKNTQYPDIKQDDWPKLSEVMASTPLAMDCMKIIIKKLNGDILIDEYYKRLLDLDKKYPMVGHNPKLTDFQMANYRTMKAKDQIQPLNFKEAAEMYRLHNNKVENDPQKWGPLYSFYKPIRRPHETFSQS